MSISHRLKIPAPKTDPAMFYLCRIGSCSASFNGLHPVMLHCDEAHAEVIARAVEEKGSEVLFSVLHLN